ncbi:MAG: TonB-dependent receptor [Acidobacteria bacterium]|nr:TonB-dependent receptor [Acidobacteriota bacterium]
MKKCYASLLFVFLFIGVFNHPKSLAQTITATISGTVTDQTGANVPNAQVSVTSTNTGQKKNVTTDNDGRFVIPFLQPGEYKVVVEASGFAKTTRTGVNLEVAQTAILDFTLKIGSATETVEVSSDAPLLTTETAALETTIENKLIEDLPSAQRSTLAFINQVPGVIDAGYALAQGENLNTNGNAQGPIGSPGNRNFFDSSFTVGGGQNSTNDVLLDGVSNTIGDFNGVAVNPPPDSIREFKVMSGVFSSEYGRSGGGVVNMITRAGGKDFHGALYEYFQNGGLNANGWQRNRRGKLASGLDVLPRIPIKRNQFGGTISGPVWLPKNIFGPLGYENPNKTFFFFNYEGRRERNPFSRELTLPTAKMRGGDFTELLTGATRAGQTDSDGAASLVGQLYDPYKPLVNSKRVRIANNSLVGLPTCPSGARTALCLDPVAQNITKLLPLPNQPGLVNNYVVSDVALFERDLMAIRVDQTVSDKHSFFGRYSKEHRFQGEPNFLGSVATNSRVIVDTFHNFTFNDVYSITPSIINNVRYGYTRARAHQTPISEGFDPGELGLPSYILQTAPIGAFPILSFANAGAQGAGIASEITGGQIGGSGNNQPRDTQTVADSVTWLKGSHNVKLGAEYRLIRFFAFQFNNPAGTYTFSRTQTRGPFPNTTPTNVTDTGSGFASFLLGIPASGSKEQLTPITVYHHYYAGYWQDDWKVNNRLTLNLGVRWDYETGTGETHRLVANFDPLKDSHLKGKVAAPADPIVRQLRPNFTDLKGIVDFPEGPATSYSKKRFAPRVGMALRLGEKTVFRGGYGIYFVPYSVEQNTALGNVFSVNAPQAFDANGQVRQPGTVNAPTVFLSNPFPNGITAPPGNSLGPDTQIGQSPLFIEPYRKNAYIQQWNVVISRELAKTVVLDVAYAGAHGVRLPYRTVNLNQIPQSMIDYAKANFAQAKDVNGVAATSVNQFFNQTVANPFFGLITNPNSTLRNATVTRAQLLKPFPQYDNPQLFNPHIGASKYNSLQVRLQKRFSDGLTGNVSYVWGKLIDIGRNGNNNSGAATSIEDIYDLEGEYAVSNFDVPHRLQASFSYELPFGKRKKFGSHWNTFTNGLLGGWQVSGTVTRQSGTPISLSANGIGLGFATRRPDRASGDASFDDAQSRARGGNTWFNTALFTQPADFTLGNGARNFTDVRRDGYRGADLSMLKNFLFFEGRHKIQLRAEFINAFNLVVFGTPGSNVSDQANFGRITTQGNTPRNIQLVLRYTF